MTMTGVLPETVHSVLAARLDSLEHGERRIVQHASVVGQTFWLGSLAWAAEEEGLDLDEAIAALQEKDLFVRSAGHAARRRAGVLVQARPDPRRRLLDAAEVGPRPQALRGRPLRLRERRRALRGRDRDRRRAFRPRGAARRRVRPRPGRARADRAARALAALEAAGDAAASLYSNQEALAHYDDRARAARAASRTTPRPGSARSRATSPSASAASTTRWRSGSARSSTTAARRTSPGSATCIARSARACGTRASARPRSATTRRGSTC